MNRAAAVAAALLLAGCTGGTERAPSPIQTAAASRLEDALIASGVKAALLAHDPDELMNVHVSVRERVVTLSGTVKSAHARDAAVGVSERVARVAAVRSALRIDPRSRGVGEQVGDVALAARIQAATAAEIGFTHIDVHVDRGIVTLEGTVRDARTRATVLRTARDVQGVRNVVDHLRVAGS